MLYKRPKKGNEGELYFTLLNYGLQYAPLDLELSHPEVIRGTRHINQPNIIVLYSTRLVTDLPLLVLLSNFRSLCGRSVRDGRGHNNASAGRYEHLLSL